MSDARHTWTTDAARFPLHAVDIDPADDQDATDPAQPIWSLIGDIWGRPLRRKEDCRRG